MIGIIPAGGEATRMHGLPKFLLPIADTFLLLNLAIDMCQTGLFYDGILIGTRDRHFSLVEGVAPEYSRVYRANTATMSETALIAYERLDAADRAGVVLFGMPDTYWTDVRVYSKLLPLLNEDVIAAVAVWHTTPAQRGNLGMCRFDGNGAGTITGIVDKPEQTDLEWAWGAIVWQPTFWKYIQPADPHVGFALQRAIEHDEIVRGLQCHGQYYDCGTPAEYFRCIKETQ